MNRLAMFVVGTAVYLSSGAQTVFYVPPDTQFIMMPSTPTVCPEVDVSTPCVQTALAVSTGPFIMKAKDSPDCYSQPYMNPNGTFPLNPGKWVPCP